MICILCHTRIDLFDLDDEGVAGMPAHATCAGAYRQSICDALDEANAKVRAHYEKRSAAA